MINKDILGKIPEKPYKIVYLNNSQDPDAPLPTNTADHKANIAPNSKKAIFYKAFTPRATLAMFVIIALVFPPYFAHASLLAKVGEFLNPAPHDAEASGSKVENSQTLALLEATPMIDPLNAISDEAVTIDSDTALVSEMGPLGTPADVEELPATDEISLYVVKKGDSISSIAKLFNVSTNTIRWANDLVVGQTVAEGTVLTILPVSGVDHTIRKNDTLKKIAIRYDAEVSEIEFFNGITESTVLEIGSTIIVPEGKVAAPVVVIKKKVLPSTGSNPKLAPKGTYSSPVYEGYYIRPIIGSVARKSQGAHKNNKAAIDLAAPTGTPIIASAGGTIFIADAEGYNGGYGKYVVIKHDNGTQTLYAHMTQVKTTVGAQVSQGEVIGLVGSTGRSTGPHVHFEVRGAANPGVTRGVWD